MIDLSKDEMIQKLKNGICEVTFIKSDGSERTMKATLLKENIQKTPSYRENYEMLVESADSNPNLIKVVDSEIDEWRSFKVDSVINFI